MKNEILEMFLGGRTVKQSLADDCAVIKKIGENSNAMTYAVKQEAGYVTAKILPIQKQIAIKSIV